MFFTCFEHVFLCTISFRKGNKCETFLTTIVHAWHFYMKKCNMHLKHIKMTHLPRNALQMIPNVYENDMKRGDKRWTGNWWKVNVHVKSHLFPFPTDLYHLAPSWTPPKGVKIASKWPFLTYFWHENDPLTPPNDQFALWPLSETLSDPSQTLIYAKWDILVPDRKYQMYTFDTLISFPDRFVPPQTPIRPLQKG